MQIKKCLWCGSDYHPRGGQHKTQKYCCRSCKDKAAWKRFVDSGDVRRRKGGYTRVTYIKAWLNQMDQTVACHYCNKRLSVEDKWVLDHKNPLSSFKTDDRKAFSNPENLTISCHSCNVLKSNTPYEEFIESLKK